MRITKQGISSNFSINYEPFVLEVMTEAYHTDPTSKSKQ